jgi:succinate dehydrogenase/fumarate reductase cytochrome b subunit
VNVTLLKALIALLPASLLFYGSTALFVRSKTAGSSLQLIGAGGLVLVVFTHICEALHLFPWMNWGAEHSAGHYLDLSSAVLGLTLVPLGYLLHMAAKRPR